MTIDERGGVNDTINFKNTSADDIRIMFDVSLGAGNVPYYAKDRTLFAHKDSDILANLKAAVALGAVDVNGAVFIYDYEDENQGIENIKTLGIDDIDEQTWYDAITTRVGNWLETYNYGSVSDALWGTSTTPACTDPDALEELLACYTDVVYSEVATDSEVIPHDPGTRGAYTGTNGNDQFVSTTGADSFELLKGNDLVTFGEKFGYDEVFSESIDNKGNTDTLKFTNYGFANEKKSLSTYLSEDIGNPGEYNLIIQTDNAENVVTYHNFLGADTPKVKIIDSTSTYYANGFTTAKNLNRSKDSKNHIDFIQADSGTSNVVANSKYNILETSGGADLIYSYNGGHDRVTTIEATDDTYIVNGLTTSTQFAIQDLGGEDTLKINNVNMKDLRLFIDVDKNRNYDESNIAIVNKSSLSAEVMPRMYAGYNAPGVHAFAVGMSGDEGIEHIQVNGNTINTNVWYSQVAQSVASWLSGTSYNKASEAIAAYNDAPDKVDISGLVAAYAKVQYTNNVA